MLSEKDESIYCTRTVPYSLNLLLTETIDDGYLH